MSDPFAQIPAPECKDQLLKLSWLACQCREQCVVLRSIGGWILPTVALPWCPRKARQLRRILHSVEACRGILQANVEHFPVMGQDEALAWVRDCIRHHGADVWPCWWSKGVVGIAEQIKAGAGQRQGE